MTAVIESLCAGQQSDDAVSFTWRDLLQLEAACFALLSSHRSLSQLPVGNSESNITVLLLPRSALLLASVLACMRLQMSWVVLSPATPAADLVRRVQLLPCVVAACVSIEQCRQSAVVATSLSGGKLLFLDHPPERSPLPLGRDECTSALPDYFTFTSGSSGAPQSVHCSGRSLWSRLLTQVSPSVPMQGLVPPQFRTLDRPPVDWRQFLTFCAVASSDAAVAASVCMWKTALDFCDTVVEMLQGVTYGATQVIFCDDGILSLRCSSLAQQFCRRPGPSQPSSSHQASSMFDVPRLFRAMHAHRVSHLTAVPSLISSLLLLEGSCCPLLHHASAAQPADASPTQSLLQGCLFQSLRALTSSGEVLHCSLVERLRSLLLLHVNAQLSLINVYGCAETTADASCFELQLPHDKCADEWCAVVPLGQALPGCCIGVLTSCSDVSCCDGELSASSHDSAAVPAVTSESIAVCWLHDAAMPAASGRVVVGGVCVAKGYASAMSNRCWDHPPELYSALQSSLSNSFFARMRMSNAADVTPVFVTMDTAEIVAHGDGQRRLLYRGRKTASLQKIRGVFVSLERVGDAAQSAPPLHIVIAAADGEWTCRASTSIAQAGFAGEESVVVVVAFDFFVEFLGASEQAMTSIPRFSCRGTLHEFLRQSVRSGLKQQLSTESLPTLHNIFVYCMNVFFAEAPPVEAFAACNDLLPCRAPLLASGKLDFTAAYRLIQGATEDVSDAVSPEANDLAAAIASCVSRVLGVIIHVPLDANFFDLGIDSLKATSLILAVQALDMHCHRHIPFEALLQHPSARALADVLCCSAALANSLSCPPSVAQNHFPEPSAALTENPAVITMSVTQISDFCHFSAEDQAQTLIIEWLPNASVRLWKRKDQHWECRIMCMTCVTSPAFGGCSQHCRRLEQERWKIDMGACVDASPLICALRRSEFEHKFQETEDDISIWPGFFVVAIIGSHTGLVAAARVSTGELVWSVMLPDRVEPGASSAVLHPHSASVLMGCYDGYLYALCICNGAVKWRFDTNYASLILKTAPSQHSISSSKRPKVSGKEELLNPEREALKGGICLIDCSCCNACSAWTKCSALIGAAGYSKRFFAIELDVHGKAQNHFCCDVGGSVAAPLLSCNCCSGRTSASRVIAAATSGWLTRFSMQNGQHFAKDWSINLGGPLFSSPVCLASSGSPSIAVASATGLVFVISAHGHMLQRLQPLESSCSFMSAPRVVLSSSAGRLVMLLSCAGTGGILVLDCDVGGVFPIAELTAECAAGAASFVSAPCVYRTESAGNKSSFIALACASDGKLYAASCNSDQLSSSIKICMQEIFDAECGVFCSPAVVPVISRRRSEVSPSNAALMEHRIRVPLAVVMGGRNNMMRCLQ